MHVRCVCMRTSQAQQESLSKADEELKAATEKLEAEELEQSPSCV